MPCSKGRQQQMRRLLMIVVPLVLVLAGCSTGSDPTAVYDGATCAYDGPSDFDAGSTVTFTVTNESETPDVGFAVFKVPEGVTAEEILEQGIFNVVFDVVPGSDALGGVDPPTAIGTSSSFSVTFAEEGQHGINCYVFPGPETGSDHVAIFTVSG
jgi:hypothetical protein